jgi:hypothetical protein
MDYTPNTYQDYLFMTSRNQEAVRLAKSGVSNFDISLSLGISHQRVNEILRNHPEWETIKNERKLKRLCVPRESTVEADSLVHILMQLKNKPINEALAS